MIQVLENNFVYATDGEHTIVLNLDAETYNKYSGNNAREITKGSDDMVTVEQNYDGETKTYKLKHFINVLGKPIFLIYQMTSEPVKNFRHHSPSFIVDETVLTC